MNQTHHTTPILMREGPLEKIIPMLRGEQTERFLLIQGEAGSGKSTLLDHFAFVTRKMGAIPLHFDCVVPENRHPLLLLHALHRQLAEKMPSVYFNELNRALSQHLRSNLRDVAINVAGEVRTVSVNLMLIKANLMLVEPDALEPFMQAVGIQPEKVVAPSHKDRINLFFQMVNRQNRLPNLVEVGSRTVPGVEWWRSLSADRERSHHSEWQIQIDDPRGRELAFADINSGFRQSLANIEREKTIVLLVDSVEKMTRSVSAWLETNLFHPIVSGQFQNIFVIAAGRQMNLMEPYRQTPLTESHILRNFSSEEIANYLRDKRGLDPNDLMTDLLFDQAQGNPALLATWVDLYRARQRRGKRS